jgi:hypothetical protein
MTPKIIFLLKFSHSSNFFDRCCGTTTNGPRLKSKQHLFIRIFSSVTISAKNFHGMPIAARQVILSIVKILKVFTEYQLLQNAIFFYVLYTIEIFFSKINFLCTTDFEKSLLVAHLHIL